MNATPLATLAQAIGLALLFAHGAAGAQHVHAPQAADADSAAAAAPASTSAPAACVCPPPDEVAHMHTPPSPPTDGDDAAMAHAGMDHPAMGHAAHVANVPAAPTTSDGSMQHMDMDHEARGDHAMSGHADMHNMDMRPAMMERDTPTAAQADSAMQDHAGMQPETAEPGPGTGEREPGKAEAHHAHSSAAATCTCASAPASALPREPIPALTDADRAAAFPVLRTHAMLHAPSRTGYLLFDRLEGWDNDHGSGQAWEASAWYGGDIDRLWLRSEGERSGGRTEAADLEALYGHAVSPWWDLLVGVKQDLAPGDARTSAAFGVQGLAPYKFELAATLYVGEGGSASARLEGEYDVLLTNRWILQPRLEAQAAFTDDRAHGVGSGLSTVEAGLRLRYAISRRFAPYLGVVHERAFGTTADYRRDVGDAARETRVVAGVRVWF